MGFRQGGYMTVWSVEEGKSGKTARVRLSSSRKDKRTGEYVQDFSGYCTFIGPAHEQAGKLHDRDRIKLGECEVTTTYDKEKKVTYVDYKVFGFEPLGGSGASTTSSGQASGKRSALDEGENDIEGDNSPF